MPNNKRSNQVKKLESYLEKYPTYRISIKNLQMQLDYIMPNLTVDYSLVPSGSGFNISSDTEKYAIDRIESRRAILIHEDMEKYKMIINSIEQALKELDELERDFIQYRYFEGYSMQRTALKLKYSEKYLYNIKNQIFDKLLISLRGLIHF